MALDVEVLANKFAELVAGAVVTKLQETQPAPTRTTETDRLLPVLEAASILGVSRRLLYQTAARLPFTRRLGHRTLRFSAAGLQRWIVSSILRLGSPRVGSRTSTNRVAAASPRRPKCPCIQRGCLDAQSSVGSTTLM